jgi:hypothetical protein
MFNDEAPNVTRKNVMDASIEWNPDVRCDDPSDVSQEDSSKLWAIDKPNIPHAPLGCERLINIKIRS